MKKSVFGLFVAITMLLGVCGAEAASKQFIVSASVPLATGVGISATKVRASDNVFLGSVNDLNFDPMTFNSANGVWVPDHYFAIDVGVTGGVGNPNVTFSFGSESKPTGQIKGLGYKATATFVKVSGATGSQTETPLAAHGPKKLLKDIGGQQIANTELVGGFLRIYAGIYPGGDATLNSAGGEPFTNGDLPGTYQGTLTVTAVIP